MMAELETVISSIEIDTFDKDEKVPEVKHGHAPTTLSPGHATARPKLLGALENAAARAARSKMVQRDKAHPAAQTTHVAMNWQGRYKALKKNRSALMPLHLMDSKKDDPDVQMSKALSRAQATAVIPRASTSQQENNAMQLIFGDEITAQHIATFGILKRLIAKWRSRAAQRKNIVAVEHFATNETQKRSIIKHKEHAIVNLPMPIVWSIKEEVLTALLDVAKVYAKEFGNNHRLTVDAKKRVDKLKADLSRP